MVSVLFYEVYGDQSRKPRRIGAQDMHAVPRVGEIVRLARGNLFKRGFAGVVQDVRWEIGDEAQFAEVLEISCATCSNCPMSMSDMAG